MDLLSLCICVQFSFALSFCVLVICYCCSAHYFVQQSVLSCWYTKLAIFLKTARTLSGFALQNLFDTVVVFYVTFELHFGKTVNTVYSSHIQSHLH